jgi:large subunit ribosomal protein L9
MKVIVRKSVSGLGEAGQVISVKDGYARNYLIPHGMVQPATGETLKGLANLKSFKEKKLDHLVKKAGETAARLAGVTITIAKPVGEGDRLFGTVTSMEIAQALAAQGLEVDRKIIHIQDPIKTLGSYTVIVKLHAQVQAPLKLEVVQE